MGSMKAGHEWRTMLLDVALSRGKAIMLTALIIFPSIVPFKHVGDDGVKG